MKKILFILTYIFICFITNAQDQITNSGNLQLHPGVSISFYGNISNNGTFNNGGQVVTFDGTINQKISGTSITTFYDVVINNSTGVTLQQSAIISNTLTLTSGPLDLNSNILTINNNSTSAITRTSGYIVSEKTDNSSKLKWNIANNTGSHTFPFGTVSGTYIPFVLNLTSGTIGNVTVSTYPTAVNNTPYPTTPVLVTNVNDIYGNDNSANTADRFWQIDKDGPSGTATLTFNVTASEASGISNLMAQRWNSGWETPLAGQSNTATSATVPNVTSFSPWALSGNSSLLPIELLCFSVKKNNDYADLKWITATETNNYGFDIEKSLDLNTWNKIGFIEGAGNSNNLLQYVFNDLLTQNIKNSNTVVYYRLKQIDFNGSFEYSETRSVNLNSSNIEIPVIFNLFPNPASQYINIISDQPLQQFQVNIFNQNGSLIRNFIMNGSIKVDISDLKPASYHIIITDKVNEKQYQYKLVKIPN